MKFGPCPVREAAGGILAHSIALGGTRWSKGRRLTEEDVAALAAAGAGSVTVARLGPEDLGEDAVAARLGARLAAPGLAVTEPFAGRVNLVAEAAGLVTVAGEAVARLNAIHEAITLATLPDLARVAPGQLVAALKIIPYGVPAALVAEAEGALAAPPVMLEPFRLRSAALIQTRTPGFKESLLAKGAEAVETRLAGLGMRLIEARIVPHETDAVASALREARADLALILGASATSDRADVAPAAVLSAGGRIARFGMPVDPGNLLFLGDLGAMPVLGLPGCARAPALNGADWVLERLAAGLTVSSPQIAAMGVGGLLKEVPARAQPRRRTRHPAPREAVEVVLLAAGGARRMRGQDKLARPVAGEPLLRRAARACLSSRARAVHVVLDPARPERAALLEGLRVTTVEAAEAPEGMAASIRAVVRALPEDAAALVLAFADMPDVSAAHIDALIAAYDPEAGAAICLPRTPAGRRGHPVLFDRRFFEPLADLAGDRGARDILSAHADFVAEVAMPDEAVLTDLDTPEAWEAYEGRACAAGEGR